MEALIVIVGMLAAFYSGFYFGYLKREGKAPEMPFPAVLSLSAKPEKVKPMRIDKEKAKENVFLA